MGEWKQTKSVKLDAEQVAWVERQASEVLHTSTSHVIRRCIEIVRVMVNGGDLATDAPALQVLQSKPCPPESSQRIPRRKHLLRAGAAERLGTSTGTRGPLRRIALSHPRRSATGQGGWVVSEGMAYTTPPFFRELRPGTRLLAERVA